MQQFEKLLVNGSAKEGGWGLEAGRRHTPSECPTQVAKRIVVCTESPHD